MQIGETDPNGLTTSWQYDKFTRRTRATRPDQTAIAWSYSDCAAVSGGCVNSRNRMAIIQSRLNTAGAVIADEWTYTDQLDRPLATKRQMLSGAYSRVDREYDALGRLSRQSAPCWASACTYYWTSYGYDLFDRLTQLSRPVSDADPTLQSESIFYEGMSVRSVDAQGKQRTRVSNAISQFVRVIDHANYAQTLSYDPFGNLSQVTDSSGNALLAATYNLRGARLSSTDADLGGWIYAPNSLNEVTSQTDANGNATTFAYDALSRLTSRAELEGTSTWAWGASSAAKNIGRLASISGLGYSESYLYDSVGRPLSTTISSDASYQIDYGYNNIGALDTLTYPVSTAVYRLKVQYEYQYGQPLRARDFNAPSTVFWQMNSTDARGQVMGETLGNGLVSARNFDAVTGRVRSIQSGPGGGGAVQNLAYLWDRVGNILQRQDNRQGLTENFYYDDLYRLDYSTLNGVTNFDFGYDALGNLSYKSDVGNYTYHPIKKHAVVNAGPFSVSYDNNGNVTSAGPAGTSTWYSFNLPNLISGPSSSGGTSSSQIFYGPSHQRWKQAAIDGAVAETTIYVGGILEKVTVAGDTLWKHYIAGPGGSSAVYTRRASGTQDTWYLTTDHLGSTDSITNAAGAVQVRLSYHAVGLRRKEAGWSGGVPAADKTAIANTTRRGFTSHEMLDAVGLVHMNGRIFHPTVGRFLSADPFISDLGHTQSYNRYSYVMNNPLSYTDPSGYLDTCLGLGAGVLSNECGGVLEEVVTTARRYPDPYPYYFSDPPNMPAIVFTGLGGLPLETVEVSAVGADETECTFFDTLSDAVLAWASDNVSFSIQGTTLGSTTGEYDNYNSFSVGITSGLQVYASNTQVASPGSLSGFTLPSGQPLSSVGAASVGFNVGTSTSLLQSGVSVQDYVGVHAYLGRGGSFELQTDASSTQGSLLRDARLRSLEVGVGLGADLIRGKVKTFSAASGPLFGLGPTQFSGCAGKK